MHNPNHLGICIMKLLGPAHGRPLNLELVVPDTHTHKVVVACTPAKGTQLAPTRQCHDTCEHHNGDVHKPRQHRGRPETWRAMQLNNHNNIR